MQRLAKLALLVLTIVIWGAGDRSAAPPEACAQGLSQCALATLAAPDDDIEGALQNLVRGATRSVHCSVSGVGNDRFARNLIQGKQRGVDVRLLEFRSIPPIGDLRASLLAAGIPVVVRPFEVQQKDLFCLIDDHILVTGGWDWSEAAGQPQQATVTLFRDCPQVLDKYRRTFDFLSRPQGSGNEEAATGKP